MGVVLWGRYLADNPIDCCALDWMAPSVKTAMGRGSYPTCQTPLEVAGTSLEGIELPIASCVATTSTTTTTPTTPTTTPAQEVKANSTDDDSNSTAVIMGIVIGAIVLVIAVLWWKQRVTSSANVDKGDNTEMRSDWSSADYATTNVPRNQGEWSSKDYAKTENLRGIASDQPVSLKPEYDPSRPHRHPIYEELK